MNHNSHSTSTPRAGQLPIDIDHVIARLADQQAHFSGYIDRRWHDLDARQLARLLSLYGQNATRLGRLLRDRCAIGGKMSEERADFFKEAWERLKVMEMEGELDGYDFPALDDEPEDDDLDSCRPPICIDDVIADLDDKQARLSQYLDRRWRDPEVKHLDRLLAVYSHNASRLGRLLRDRCALYGEPPDPFKEIINAALDRLSEEWGIDL